MIDGGARGQLKLVGSAKASVLKSIVTTAGKAVASKSMNRVSHKLFSEVAWRLPKSSVLAEAGVCCPRLGLSKRNWISPVVAWELLGGTLRPR